MGEDLSIAAAFASIAFVNDSILKVYNWDGSSLWGGGTGDDQDRIYLRNAGLSDSELARISFYSGFGSGFLGTGFDLGFQDGFAHQIIPVPEPETWTTGMLLSFAGMVWMFKLRRKMRRDLTC